MQHLPRWVAAALLAVVAGCTVSPSRNDRVDATRESPAGESASTERPASAIRRPIERRFAATVVDRFNVTCRLTDVSLFVPRTSLLGEDGGDIKHAFVLMHGVAEMEVPFQDVEAIVFKQIKSDRIEAVIFLRGAAPPDGRLDGTFRSTLELRGLLESTDLHATVIFRDLARVTIEETPPHPK